MVALWGLSSNYSTEPCETSGKRNRLVHRGFPALPSHFWAPPTIPPTMKHMARPWWRQRTVCPALKWLMVWFVGPWASVPHLHHFPSSLRLSQHVAEAKLGFLSPFSPCRRGLL